MTTRGIHRRRTARLAGAVGLTVALLLGALPAQAATSTPVPDVAQHERWGSGFSTWTHAVATDPDGGVLIGGQFTAFRGDAGVPSRLIKLDSTGEPDAEFNARLGAGFPSGAVRDIERTPDGGYLVAGTFTTLDGVSVPTGLLRLRADGEVDTAFSANLGAGFSPSVSSVETTADGKILVAGNMTPQFAAGEPRPRNLVRLNADGSPDTAFNAALGAGFDDTVFTTAETSDGRILVGGDFSSLDGVPGPRGLVRLEPDGSPDTAFNASLGAGTGPGVGRVDSVVVRPDGGTILSGEFQTFDGDASVPDFIMALGASGRPDTAFNDRLGPGLGNAARSVDTAPDGHLLVTGSFSSVAGVAIPAGITRILADGSPDLGYFQHLTTGFSSSVDQLGLLPDGTIVAVGTFSTLDDAPPRSIARLSPVTLDVGPLEDRTDIVGAAVDVAVPVTISPARDVTTTVTGLPPGVEVDEESGHVVGAPTEVGSWEVEVSATATLPGGPLTESARFTWTVAAPGVAPTLAGTPDVGVVDQPYSFPFTLTGDPLPQVEVTRGDLPPGLDLSPEGLLSGTPTAAGSYPLTLTATNGTAPDATLETVVRITTTRVALPSSPDAAETRPPAVGPGPVPNAPGEGEGGGEGGGDVSVGGDHDASDGAASTGAAPDGALPLTGAGLVSSLVAAAVLLVAGTVVTAARRRR